MKYWLKYFCLIFAATAAGCNATVTVETPSETPHPSIPLLYSVNPANYNVGSAITPNVPNTSNTRSGYTISPALPAGLSLDFSTGVISGTPLVASPTGSYVITANDSQGPLNFILTLTVNDAAPSNLIYSSNIAIYTVGSAISDNFPSSSGGTVTKYSISPTLPQGLSFNTLTGIISGTPATPAAARTYVVTAFSSADAYTTTDLTIAVNDAVSTLTYSEPAVTYTVGTEITDNIPTSTGPAITTYEISPALPAGLSLNSSTGVISGTPATATLSKTYLVTATTSGAPKFTHVTFGVIDAPPSDLTYTSPTAIYTKGATIPHNSPSTTGGSPTSYSVAPALPTGLSLNTISGVISGIPFVIRSTSSFTVTATNSGGSISTTLSITIIDIPPRNLDYFRNPATYTKGTAILANSPSSTGGNILSYSVSPALPTGLALNSVTGVISGTPQTVAAANTYTVTGVNTGGSTTTNLTITVNDVPPLITYPLNPATYTKGTAISVNSPVSTGGTPTSFSVSPSLPSGLSLDSTSGDISGTPTAFTPSATYTITATNSGGPRTTSLTIAVNDAAPSDLAYSTGSAVYTKGTAISPNTPSSGGGDVTSYSVSPALPAGLSFNATTGVISGTPTAVAASASYLVVATNSGGTAQFSLTIRVNDVSPSGLSYFLNPAVYTLGTPISANSPASTGGTILSYSISPTLPSGLSFNTATGVISGTPQAVAASTAYTITASNTGGSDELELTLTVNDIAPVITYTSTSNIYTKGTSIAANNPISTGGTPISYTVSPSLPLGLSLNSTSGVISGTPTVISSSNTYTVTATNSGGSGTANLTLTVNDVAPSNLSYSTAPATYSKGIAIASNTPTSTGGIPTHYSILPALPSGLSFNTSTGVISGTPSAITATASYLITATNSGGSSSVELSITVNDAPPSIQTYSLSPAFYVKSIAISPNTPSVSGGDISSYSIFPELPAGLSFDTSTGVISGTPTQVSSSVEYLITATGSGGSSTFTLTLKVDDDTPSNLAYSLNPAIYTKGTAISSNTPSSSGGSISSYSISPSLPAGLTMSTSTGIISGTPTVVSPSTTYTITGNYPSGSITVSLTLTVNDVSPSALSYSSNPAVYTKDTAITANSPSSSGGAIVSYSISPDLPDGLSLDTTSGTISGTPTTITAAANYTVTATNSGGSATATLNIRVNDVPPAALTYSDNPVVYTKSSAITANTPSSTGGAIVSYSISPSLPTGLSLNTLSGLISGTPTVVSAATNYTVTATNASGSTTATVNIRVIDIPPTSLTYSTLSPVYTKGTAITNNTATVTGGGPITSYSISPSLPTGLSFNTTSGLISGTPSVVAWPASTYTVTAANSGGSATVDLSIAVKDIAPSSLSYTSNSPIYTKDSAITSNSPTSGGGAVVSYSVSPSLPVGLSLDTTSGVITGTPTVVTVATNYTVTATNSGGSTTRVLNITVRDAAPSSLTYSSNPAIYTKSSAIPDNTPSSSGGPVVSYSVSPALPAGLALNTTSGVITGTPTAITAATNYTVTATNSGGSTTATVNIKVNDIPPSNLNYSTNPATYTKSSAITNNTPSSSGGAVVSYSISPSLPTGLAFNTTSGVISGTPTALSSTTVYTITATNTGGSATRNLTLTVVDIAPSSLSYTLNPAEYVKDTPISNNSPTSSGGAITSYSISQTLPAGLSFNTSTGVISGTPTANAPLYSYVVTATNSGGSTTASVSIIVGSDLTNRWTWMGGSAAASAIAGVYGTLGVAASTNYPGSRYLAAYPKTRDANGNMWIFGGTGYPGVLSFVKLNDLWKWDGTNWTWMSGSATTNSAGNWGSLNVASTSNRPSGRQNAIAGIDAGGNLLIFGGTGWDAANTNSNMTLNDLWKWDGTNWTWISGSSVANQISVYGTKGSPSPTNIPGARSNNTGWHDLSGNLWIFGGLGYAAATTSGYLNDLWRWDGTNWTWMAGNTTTYTGGNFGTKGVTSSSSYPANKYNPSSTVDAAGNGWVFGGEQFGQNQLNDLWKWNGTNWTWMAGSSTGGSSVSSNSGTLGVASASNYPMGRRQSVMWSENGNIWVLGGNGGWPTANNLGDLWRWNGTNWVWVKGPAGDQAGSYGTKGQPASGNFPGSSLNGIAWADTGTGHLWLFGGYINPNNPSNVAMKYTLPIPPSNFGYSSPTQIYTKGVTIPLNFPIYDGSSLLSFTISPALPAGLLFDAATGVISGTALVTSPATTYTITGTNFMGSLTTTVNLTVTDFAPTDLTYSTEPGLYDVGYPITNTPSSNGGNVQSYSISPTLPAGLSFSTLTGIISGTPTTATSTTSYTVTGTNPGGSTTRTFDITVSDAAPANLTYSTNPATYYAGYPIFNNNPSFNGSPVTTYSVSPALPDGLSLNASTGVISGTPTTPQDAGSYIITATNAYGSTTATLSIEVGTSAALTSFSYPLSAYSLQPNVAMTPIAANFTGGPPSSCSTSPSLPSGVSINSICTISGTPTGPGGSVTNYTVTATTSFGSLNTTVTLSVAGQTQKWTWVSGSGVINSNGVYGTKGTPATSNLPGARQGSAHARDAFGNLWVYGGSGSGAATTGRLNDLWKWDGTNWTWISGHSTVNVTGVYGTQGTPSSTIIPGSREFSSLWADTAGAIWLYGGYGYDSTGTLNYLNDVWKWDGVNWTWVMGNTSGTQVANFGTKGIAATSNNPGGRNRHAYWQDSYGNFWIYGGYRLGYGADLWKWDGTNWTWMAGPSATAQVAVYGFKGFANSANFPGSRMNTSAVSDSYGNVWLWGGWGYPASSPGYLNDLWKWDGVNWTWITGSSMTYQPGTYSSQGTASSTNNPEGKERSSLLIDSANNLWLFGGLKNNNTTNTLWKWDGTNWTWISGSSGTVQTGVYGTKGVPSASTSPGSKTGPVGWIDSANNLYYFGGWGRAQTTTEGTGSDLFKYTY